MGRLGRHPSSLKACGFSRAKSGFSSSALYTIFPFGDESINKGDYVFEGVKGCIFYLGGL
jgi:hypothetical protein